MGGPSGREPVNLVVKHQWLWSLQIVLTLCLGIAGPALMVAGLANWFGPSVIAWIAGGLLSLGLGFGAAASIASVTPRRLDLTESGLTQQMALGRDACRWEEVLRYRTAGTRHSAVALILDSGKTITVSQGAYGLGPNGVGEVAKWLPPPSDSAELLTLRQQTIFQKPWLAVVAGAMAIMMLPWLLGPLRPSFFAWRAEESLRWFWSDVLWLAGSMILQYTGLILLAVWRPPKPTRPAAVLEGGKVRLYRKYGNGPEIVLGPGVRVEDRPCAGFLGLWDELELTAPDGLKLVIPSNLDYFIEFRASVLRQLGRDGDA